MRTYMLQEQFIGGSSLRVVLGGHHVKMRKTVRSVSQSIYTNLSTPHSPLAGTRGVGVGLGSWVSGMQIHVPGMLLAAGMKSGFVPPGHSA